MEKVEQVFDLLIGNERYPTYLDDVFTGKQVHYYTDSPFHRKTQVEVGHPIDDGLREVNK